MPELAISALVAGLPPGPATEDAVRAQLRIEDDIDDPTLEMAINAVNAAVIGFDYVDRFVRSIDPAAPDNRWPFDIVAGSVMLASRIFKRRNSTEGVASFGDQGAVYVQRNDPDVALLLKLGAHRQPAVG